MTHFRKDVGADTTLYALIVFQRLWRAPQVQLVRNLAVAIIQEREGRPFGRHINADVAAFIEILYMLALSVATEINQEETSEDECVTPHVITTLGG